MRIHSDILGTVDIFRAVPRGCDVDSLRTGSRSRSLAFTVKLFAIEGGTLDAYGVRRNRKPNPGTAQGESRYIAEESTAATWQDWGDFIAALYAVDPRAIIGQYKDAADFLKQTREEAPRRRVVKPAAVVAARHWRLWLDRQIPYHLTALERRAEIVDKPKVPA